MREQYRLCDQLAFWSCSAHLAVCVRALNVPVSHSLTPGEFARQRLCILCFTSNYQLFLLMLCEQILSAPLGEWRDYRAGIQVQETKAKPKKSSK